MRNTPKELNPNAMHVKELWGREKERDVFVVGTGTSLAGFDWRTLDGRRTIAMNDAVKVPGFAPTYHIFVDEGIFVRYVNLPMASTVVVCRPGGRQKLFEHPKCRFANRIYQFDHVHEPDFDPKSDSLFCRSTVATAAIEMAWKLGTRRILLLGVDGYRLPNAYYWTGAVKQNDRRPESEVEGGRIVQDRHVNWRRDMRALRNAFLARKLPLGPWPGAGVYNLSPRSTIDAWERVDPTAAFGGGDDAMNLDGIRRPDMPEAEFPAFARSVRLASGVAGSYLEIGVKYAWSTRAVLQLLNRLGAPHRLVSIDPDPRVRGHHAAAVAECAGQCKTRLLVATSRRLASHVHDHLAWLFVDGCHCEACVLHDIEAYGPKVTPGGLVVIHDTSEWAERNHSTPCAVSGKVERLGARSAVAQSKFLSRECDLIDRVEDGEVVGIRVYRRRP